MAYFGTTELGLKDITNEKAFVANDPRAKLMYYLACIDGVLDMADDRDIGRLKDYENYQNLSRQETQRLRQMCLLLSPDLLEDKCIFQSDALCQNWSAKFYEVSAVRNNFLVAGNVMVGGRRRQVTKIMTYKRSWLQEHYTDPMERLQEEGCAIL